MAHPRRRLPAEVKRRLVGAIMEAKTKGLLITRACEILMIDGSRVHRWIGGRDPEELSTDDLKDTPLIAKACPHKLTEGERKEAPWVGR